MESDDICGLCGQLGADKIPQPHYWPGEQRPGSEYVHAECENQESARAHAALSPAEIEYVLRDIMRR